MRFTVYTQGAIWHLAKRRSAWPSIARRIKGFAANDGFGRHFKKLPIPVSRPRNTLEHVLTELARSYYLATSKFRWRYHMIAIRWLCLAGLLLALTGFATKPLTANLQASQAPAPDAAKESPVAKLGPEDIVMGKQLFAGNCAGCHGFDGGGQLGPNLHGVAERKGDAGVFAVIRNGQGGMPPQMSLNDQRAWQVVAFVRTLGESGSTEVAKGDAMKGKAVYDANGCALCHAIDGQGGGVGPQLTTIGKSRVPSYFHAFLLDPGKNPPPDMTLPERGSNTGYLMVHIVTKDGKDVTGIRVNEDTFTIELRDVGGHFYSFDKSKLKTITPEAGKTVMPSYSTLSATDLDDLVAYLSSLKGAR
jgi:cytochrome c oxidase cbb3-type subunit III